jgi:hypothetical protein
MKFRTNVELGGKTATGLPVPEDVVASFGSGRRYPVVVTLNGYSYRTTVSWYGGQFVVPLSAEHREASGVVANQEVEVEMTLDTAPREVEIPEDLATAFEAEPAAKAFFGTLSNTNKKTYTTWIESAKKEETRRDRVAKAISLLNEGKTTRV